MTGELVNPLDRKVSVLEREAAALQVINDTTRVAADIVVGKLKDAEKEIEDEKEALCRPLLTELEEKRSPRLKAVKLLESIRRALEQRVGQYVAKKQQEEIEAQRLLLAEAARVQADAEAKAEAARQAAAAAAASGDTVTATKLEAKAEKLELKAATTVVPVVETTSRTTSLGDGASLTNKSKPDWELIGRDKTEKLHADDPLFAPLDWVKFRRFFVLDQVRVNQAVAAGEKLPIPFKMTVKYGSTQWK